MNRTSKYDFFFWLFSLSILAASGTSSALSDHSVKRFTQLGLIIRKGKWLAEELWLINLSMFH